MPIACTTVKVTEPPIQTAPNITAIYGDIAAKRGSENRPITDLTLPFEPALNLVITIGWRNTGNARGAFTPKVVVNSQVLYGSSVGNASRALEPDEQLVETFLFGVGSPGTYSICPDPN